MLGMPAGADHTHRGGDGCRASRARTMPVRRRGPCTTQLRCPRVNSAKPVATTPRARATGATADDLLLRVTPPRVPRHQVTRPRLQSDDPQLRDFPVLVVQAGAGFGKTSLLAQWRREHLARGTVVAWLSAQAQDHVPRFVQSLALS